MLGAVIKAFKGSRIQVGAQDVSANAKGAYTGENSAAQLADLGVKYVIVGHSERRQYHNETDKIVSEKVARCLENNLTPIVCVGETLEQRRMDMTMDIIHTQIKGALSRLNDVQARECVVAYEPIWAIGTGIVATPEDASIVTREIRTCIRNMFDARIARTMSILYGGSMNGDNAKSLLAKPDIDGGLIGGASLEPAKFLEIIEATQKQ
jgi:triosephosphate isomerase